MPGKRPCCTYVQAIYDQAKSGSSIAHSTRAEFREPGSGILVCMNNYDFVLGLRAIRGYGEQPISSEDMTAILEGARWTGSSKNLQNWAFVVVTDREQLDRVAACGRYTDPVRNSAATVVLVEERGGYEFDSGRVAQNIMLAAKARGVASCPITLHDRERAAELLRLGEGRSCHYAVALGYPAVGAEPAVLGGRKPLADLVHWQTYGGLR